MMFISEKRIMFAVGALMVLVLAACGPAVTEQPTEPVSAATPGIPQTGSVTPSVTVADQEISNGNVIVQEAVSDGPGWLVIHADADGKPGSVIGYAPLMAGSNKDIQVEVDMAGVTETLYAMLHMDAGQVGTYEFPGVDGPMMTDGQMVSRAFKVLQAVGSGASQEPAVKVAEDPQLGSYLVDSEGMTLYLFTSDEPGVSNCTGQCLVAWPPLKIEGELVAGEGVTGKLGTIMLEDGSRMVTYNDIPLYYYAADEKPGDTLGQGVGGVWFVVSP